MLERSLLQPHERLRGHTGAPEPLRSRHWIGTFQTTPRPAAAAAPADGAAAPAPAAGPAGPAAAPVPLGALSLRFLPPDEESREVAAKLPFLPAVLDGQLGRWSEKEDAELGAAVARAAGAVLFERELQVRWPGALRLPVLQGWDVGRCWGQESRNGPGLPALMAGAVRMGLAPSIRGRPRPRTPPVPRAAAGGAAGRRASGVHRAHAEPGGAPSERARGAGCVCLHQACALRIPCNPECCYASCVCLHTTR